MKWIVTLLGLIMGASYANCQKLDSLVVKDKPRLISSVGVFTGYHKSYRNLNSSNQSFHVNFRDSLEKPSDNFLMGINVVSKNFKNWSFSFGLVYSRMGYESDFEEVELYEGEGIIGQEQNIVEGLLNDPMRGFINEYPDYYDLRLNYTLTGNSPSKGSLKYTMLYEFIELPLLVRYNMQLKNWKVFLAAGGAVNFLLNDRSYKDIKLETGDAKLFDWTDYLNDQKDFYNRTNYSGIAQIGAERKLSRRLGMWFNVEYQYMFRPLLQNDEIDEYLYRYGCSLGLSYSFFNKKVEGFSEGQNE